MKAIPLILLWLISFFVSPQLVSSNVSYLFVTNNLIGEVYLFQNTTQLVLMNLSGYTIRLPLEGIAHLYSYSNYLLVFVEPYFYVVTNFTKFVNLSSGSINSTHTTPNFMTSSLLNDTLTVYVINTLTMRYYKLNLKELSVNGNNDYGNIDGIYAFNVASKILSTTNEEVYSYTVVVPKVEIIINVYNLITNSTRTISFVTTGLPLSFEKDGENFTGKPYAVLNPNNNFLYIITSNNNLQYIINVINLTSGRVSRFNVSFNGEIADLTQDYLTFYNTSEVMLYNPVNNITISYPFLSWGLINIACVPSTPNLFPLITYTNESNNSLVLPILSFTNGGKNISIAIVPLILFCGAITENELIDTNAPKIPFSTNPNEIKLNSVPVTINGNVVPSVSEIYIFESSVLLKTSNGYLVYNDGKLINGQVVSGVVITNVGNADYAYENVLGVNQPIILMSTIIIGGKPYYVPEGKYVVGNIGNNVVLYGNGEISVMQVNESESGIQVNMPESWLNIGIVVFITIVLLIVIITLIKLLRKKDGK
ncbi:hypothetical protein [Saccharolobus shibatae]|uniref:Uncharacterized protein n=1 Tax=Saccharolobus shibatae TaxID=2286 RepID=A0A8F5BVN5_9CREN|nr:hypothetical protein [Saccharolobus shibatae]QXJ32301.1 hypothetical protein J5U21_01952 [Saccharolobus shibatae]QXJ35359.1 hypothetical protein J5U22_01906 [Saccharolobus shibatae]